MFGCPRVCADCSLRNARCVRGEGGSLTSCDGGANRVGESCAIVYVGSCDGRTEASLVVAYTLIEEYLFRVVARYEAQLIISAVNMLDIISIIPD